jgi:hypothetical protein
VIGGQAFMVRGGSRPIGANAVLVVIVSRWRARCVTFARLSKQRKAIRRNAMPGPADEHVDDLESIVREGAEEETAGFPNTDDELDDAFTDGEDDEPFLDEDPSEL